MSEYFMWSEKHPPKSLDECILEGFPAHVQKTLKAFDKANAVPNILLYGIAGTGKSTVAKILSEKEGYHVIWKNGSLLNKDNVRDLLPALTNRSLYGDRRLIFIDEADGMTQAAQLALRSLIDPRYEASWLLTCNFRKKLIEPIQSRFMQIECSLPPSSDRDRHIAGIVRRCQQILNAENISGISHSDLAQIANEKYPDIRQTINECQMRFSFLASQNQAF
jgi:DNA polymerase III delta prime subunit